MLIKNGFVNLMRDYCLKVFKIDMLKKVFGKEVKL